MKEKVLNFKFKDNGNISVEGLEVPKDMLQMFTLFLSDKVYNGYMIKYNEKS